MLGHRGTHWQLPDTHASPLAQRVPVPAQVAPGQVFAMVAPQVTVLAAGQLGAHSHMRVVLLQRCPVAQRVPVPQEVAPGHTLGMSCPQSTCAGDWLHRGAHTHAPALHT
jgi:hypothetical protein